uniref:Uncharacterized protein n=1 Tax=Kalanchoe fedtschenkoi TaxID=63787 RepID=A0A7N0ZXN8_KALFE
MQASAAGELTVKTEDTTTTSQQKAMPHKAGLTHWFLRAFDLKRLLGAAGLGAPELPQNEHPCGRIGSQRRIAKPLANRVAHSKSPHSLLGSFNLQLEDEQSASSI